MVPAQMHDTDAGKEREMAPIPRHKLPCYKSAGKVQVSGVVPRNHPRE